MMSDRTSVPHTGRHRIACIENEIPLVVSIAFTVAACDFQRLLRILEDKCAGCSRTMPGLLKKLDISAGGDGIVIQSHGEHHAILVEYRTQKVSKWTKPRDTIPKDDVRMESHGVVGMGQFIS